MGKMIFEEFAGEVMEKIKDYLPEKYEDCAVSVNEVVKNNDTKLHALTIASPGGNVAPAIYLEQFYGDYKDGHDMEDVLEEIARVRLDHEVSQDMEVSRLTDYKQVEDRITARLINAEKNAEYLSDKPHKLVDDLAVVYSINLGEHEGGTMSVTVTDNLLEKYGVSVDDLHEAALSNMDEIAPSVFKSMGQILTEMMGDDFPPEMLPPEDTGMYILSNSSRLYGASALLDVKVMSDIAERFGEFYILPSSVHETIIIPKRDGMEISELEAMVRDVNSTQVAEHEQLSDYVYTYDSVSHEIYRAGKENERLKTRERGSLDIKPTGNGIKDTEKKPSILKKLAENKEKAATMEKKDPVRDVGKKKTVVSLD